MTKTPEMIVTPEMVDLLKAIHNQRSRDMTEALNAQQELNYRRSLGILNLQQKAKKERRDDDRRAYMAGLTDAMNIANRTSRGKIAAAAIHQEITTIKLRRHARQLRAERAQRQQEEKQFYDFCEGKQWGWQAKNTPGITGIIDRFYYRVTGALFSWLKN